MDTITAIPEKLPHKKRTLDQAKDTGMAFVLICLIIWLSTRNNIAILCAMLLLLLNMAVPKMYLPFARIWFYVSELIGIIVSKILLTIIFFLLVLPIGFVRKWLKIDSLHIKAFKISTSSVFTDRNHQYTSADMTKPF